jgi:hypothetical protein
MYFRSTLAAVAAVLIAFADVPDGTRLRMPLPGIAQFSSLPGYSLLPDIFVSVIPQSPGKSAGLQENSRIEIIRYVSGEFAKAVKPLPRGKNGYKYPVSKKLDEKDLNDALRKQGTAVNPGDTIQITSLEFRPKEIVFQLNGGGRKHFHIKEHLQIGIGTAATPTAVSNPNEGTGATLVLDYGRSVPDMSADDLMHDLEPFLDFSKRHSAAVNWVETLPPKFKQAIEDHVAVEGMDHDMVLAAMGRPEHKVRERTEAGEETEDWIYGTPPGRTTFVTFSGDKVIRVKQFS